MNFYFDIETIPSQIPGVREEFEAAVEAPGQYKKPDSIAEWLKENRAIEGEKAWLKTSFDGGLGHACVIAFAVDNGEPKSYQATTREGEKRMLEDFFHALKESGYTRLIGHNIIGFDIPFLWKRAMVLGVKPPFSFPRNPKPWGDTVIDTMLLWDSQQKAGGSMDRLCKILGIPGKGDMDGSKVWPMFQEGRLTEIALYCKGDVARTRSMHQRMTFAEPAAA